MSSRDLVHNISVKPAWPGATIATNTDTTATVVIDSAGCEAVAFAVYSGAYTDGTYLLKIMETDNSDGTTGAAEVAAYQQQDSFGAASSTTVKKVGAVLSKRYCTLRITSTGTTTGCVFKGAVALLGHCRARPVA